MAHHRLRHDVAAATAKAILEIVAPCLREEEQQEAWGMFLTAKGYASDMTSVAYSPLQVKLAESFRDFVQGLEPHAEAARDVSSPVTLAPPRETPVPANDSPWAKLVKGPRAKPKEKDGPEMEP